MKNVSVIIRTYNEAEYIARLCQVLRDQEEYGENLEIMVVDSGSDDGTVELVKGMKAILIEIPQEKFTYSGALNSGIEASNGDYLVFLSAHAIPRNREWIKKMLEPFSDEETAGVYSRQVAWPEAGLDEMIRLSRTFGEESRLYRGVDRDKPAFSNAASCIRRVVWEKHSFVEMPAAEDREWAEWVLSHGWRIEYQAEAEVYHSHQESCRKAAHRVMELEQAADEKLGRRRTRLLTLKQAVGWFFRSVKEAITAKSGPGKKITYLVKSVLRSVWYVAEWEKQKTHGV